MLNTQHRTGHADSGMLSAPAHKYGDISPAWPGALAGGVRGPAWAPAGVTVEQGDEKEPCGAPEGQSPYGSAAGPRADNTSPNLRPAALNSTFHIPHSAFRIAFPALLLAFALPMAAYGDLFGSPHDFRAQGWSGGTLCGVCHTPHHADVAVPKAPLWNHKYSTATYTLYSSPTLKASAYPARALRLQALPELP